MCCNKICSRNGPLQTKVEIIAISATVLSVVSLFGEIMQYSNSSWSLHLQIDNKVDQQTIIGITMESALGLMTCVLLFIGAKTRNKYLLIPFMFMIALLLVFLVISLILLGTFSLISHDLNLFVGAVFVLLLASLMMSILQTIKAYYNELTLNPTGTIMVDAHTNGIGDDYDMLGNDIEMNAVSPNPHSSGTNPSHAAAESQNHPQYPPPPYEEAPATATSQDENCTKNTDVNMYQNLPPTYEEALVLAKQNVSVSNM